MTTIEQHPLYTLLPVGQNVVFSVSNDSAVSTYTKVKIIAEVYISDTPIVLANEAPIGTFKTTPNDAGVGMFDFRPIIESYVSSDNLGVNPSTYKGVRATDNSFPIDLVDKYSRNENIARYLVVNFKTEYLDPITNKIIEATDNAVSAQYTIFNGYLKYTDNLKLFNDNFGFDTSIFNLSTVVAVGDATARFLTNAPNTQYATEEDYGTLAFISTATGDNVLAYIKLTYTENDSSTSFEKVVFNYNHGAYNGSPYYASQKFLYFGCFPANLRNWSSNFQALVTAGTLASYTVQGYNNSDVAVTEQITINKLCPTKKGFEPIRLKWLNQWGVWDYKTFNMKSTKSISTKGSTYQQLEGTWNDSKYSVNGYKGGKKAFRVNAMEKVTMNTDFVSEAESEWFEELINSPEVFIIEGYKTDSTVGTIYSALNTYQVPVRLTTSNYTRKTVANDKLMQYTFEVEKSKTLRTQAI